MEKGKIIVLNGVSSAGKTTLAKSVQRRANSDFAWLSIDSFCDMWPEKRFDGDFTELLLAIQTVFHHTIKLFSDRGIDVIADTVHLEPFHTLEEMVALLSGYPVLLVGVTCPIEELRRREAARGDREPGQAESQLPYLVPQDTYDLVVDTFHSSAEDCADRIIQLAGCIEQQTAFKKLCEKANAGDAAK